MENPGGTSNQPWNTAYVIRHIYPQNNSQTNIKHSRDFPTKINMPKMSSTDATIHVAQDLIHALHNPAPYIPHVILVNEHGIIGIPNRYIFRINLPRSTSKDSSQEGIQRKTLSGEAIINPI